MTYPSNPSPTHPGQQAYPGQPAGAPWPPPPGPPPHQGQYPPPGQLRPGRQPPGGHAAPGRHPASAHPATLSASFIRHTGMLVLWQQGTRRCHGTFEQVNREYQAAQRHCLLAGWWSISSIIFFNWYALFKNMYEMSKVKKAAGR